LGGIEASHWGFVVALLISTLINVALFARVFDKGLYVHGHGSDHASEATNHSSGNSVRQPLSVWIPALIVILAILLAGIFNQAILKNIVQFALPSGL
jgi:multicomponent Na+:H+ antiporter subunit D